MGTYAYFSKTKFVDMRHILLFLTIAFGLSVNAQDLAIITFDSLTIDYEWGGLLEGYYKDQARTKEP